MRVTKTWDKFIMLQWGVLINYVSCPSGPVTMIGKILFGI